MNHTAPISGIASYTFKYVATAGYDNRLILWNASTKDPLAVGHHNHLVNQCEFSACGKYLISASSDHTARVWLLPEMKLIAVLAEHSDDIEGVAVHPNLQLIATASRDHKVRVFDLYGKLLNVLNGHTADVITIQWLERAAHLISSSDDGTIRIWDISLNKQIGLINNNGIQTDALAIANDGTVYAGDDAGSIHVIRETGMTAFPAHEAGIKKLIYDKTRGKLLSIAYDRKGCLWEVRNNGQLKLNDKFNLPNIVWPRSSAFQDKDKIVFATFGTSYATYDYKLRQWFLENIGPTHGINSVMADSNNIWTIGDVGCLRRNNCPVNELPSLCNFLIKIENKIISGGQTGEIFEACTGEVIFQYHAPLNCAAVFSIKEKTYVIIGAYTGEGIVFEYQNQKFIHKQNIALHDNAIKGIACTKNTLFSVCATGAAAWHSLNNFAFIKRINNAHHKIANACIALGDELFASVSRDKLLRIWSSNQLQLLEEITTPHTHSIKCLAVDTHSRYLASGSYNGQVCIYDKEQKYWHSMRPTIAGISSVSFSNSKQTFIAASYEGHVYEIDLHPSIQIKRIF